MRKVVLTKSNIGHVTALLKKFFNNNRFGFTTHHNFDCGWKNIKPYSQVKLHNNVDNIEVVREDWFSKVFIRITYQEGVSGEVIYPGAILVFRGGNEIIIQKKWDLTDVFNYVYTVYRLEKLDKIKEREINERRYFEKSMSDAYWADIEREYEHEKYEDIEFEEELIEMQESRY